MENFKELAEITPDSKKEVKSKRTSARQKDTFSFETDGVNFAIKKTHGKSEKTFVAMPMKSLFYYVKDGQAEKISNFNTVNLSRLRTFLGKQSMSEINVKWVSNTCLFDYSNDQVYRFFNFIDSDVFKYVAKTGKSYFLNGFVFRNTMNLEYIKSIEPVIDLVNQEIPTWLNEKNKEKIDFLCVIHLLYKNRPDIEQLDRIWLRGLMGTSLRISYVPDFDRISYNEKKLFQNSDAESLMNYLLFDSYRQGYNNISLKIYASSSDPISDLAEYQKIAKNVYGKIEDPYPKHLRTALKLMKRHQKEKEAEEQPSE